MLKGNQMNLELNHMKKGGPVKEKKYDISFNVDHLSDDMATISTSILNLLENKEEIKKIQKKINNSEDGYDVDSPIMYKYDKLLNNGIMDYLMKIGLKRNQIEFELEDDSFSVMISNASENVLTKLKAFNPKMDEAEEEMKKGGKTKMPKRSAHAIELDSEIKAKKPGKRVSASGNVYYESRPNHADENRKKKPYLEMGGKMKMGGALKPIPKDNKGLPNLPENVRNNMGYKEMGGKMEMGGEATESKWVYKIGGLNL